MMHFANSIQTHSAGLGEFVLSEPIDRRSICGSRGSMSILVTFRKQLTNETLEVSIPKGRAFLTSTIVSPFDDASVVTVIEVTSDAPRHCYEIKIGQ
jgi:hypothetical protein